MKTGILGTRGIPNNYGGFEQFSEFFATYAAQVSQQTESLNSICRFYRNITNYKHLFTKRFF